MSAVLPLVPRPKILIVDHSDDQPALLIRSRRRGLARSGGNLPETVRRCTSVQSVSGSRPQLERTVINHLATRVVIADDDPDIRALVAIAVALAADRALDGTMIVMLSAAVDPTSREAGFDAGGAHFPSKPFSPRELAMSRSDLMPAIR